VENVTPLNNRVVLRAVSVTEPDRTASGILLAPSKRPPTSQGEVVSVGPGLYNQTGGRNATDLKPGDRVLYNPNAAMEMTVDRETLLLISEVEIFAKLNSK
jgi:chaperonin GroES